MMRAYLLLLFDAIIGLTGCSEQNSAKELDYEQTKNMVVDILQTDEGKKALQEIITDEKMKHHLVMESDVVKKSITDTLASEEGTEMWKKLLDRKSTRLNSSHVAISYAVYCLKKKILQMQEYQ